jgi:hypothetical protein
MPYIKQDRRDYLDASINNVVDALRQLESDFGDDNNFEGNMNYVISSIIAKTHNISYRSINDIVGMLECVKQEYYRKLAAKYEDQKEYETSSVY